ncbi:hypothetical protein ACIBKY_51240 [Nonomuraea sp. NPDC050394]|uniref:hypothetical protein n=1 Tax=Nonomuraea sp. NPDC050394 TaxID=3364363 RepID=UPI0037A2E1E9
MTTTTGTPETGLLRRRILRAAHDMPLDELIALLEEGARAQGSGGLIVVGKDVMDAVRAAITARTEGPLRHLTAHLEEQVRAQNGSNLIRLDLDLLEAVRERLPKRPEQI